MLCPECRRMVGKDGYCPMGHLARPELQMQPPKAAPPPLSAAPPVPAAPKAPAPSAPLAGAGGGGPQADRYTPPGLGPSNPPPAAQAAPGARSFAPGPPSAIPGSIPGSIPGAIPGGPPPLPPDQLFAVGGSRRRRTFVSAGVLILALVVAAYFLLGPSAGASNLKLVFTPGETHRYSFEMVV